MVIDHFFPIERCPSFSLYEKLNLAQPDPGKHLSNAFPIGATCGYEPEKEPHRAI
jgi:hypothetical protein